MNLHGGGGGGTVSGHRESLQELVCLSSNVFQEGGDTAVGGETWEQQIDGVNR